MARQQNTKEEKAAKIEMTLLSFPTSAGRSRSHTMCPSPLRRPGTWSLICWGTAQTRAYLALAVTSIVGLSCPQNQQSRQKADFPPNAASQSIGFPT